MGEMQHVEQLVDSGARLAALETNDVARVLALFKRLSRDSGRAVYTWAPGQGLRRLGLDHIVIPRSTRPGELLAGIESSTHFGIYLLQDFQSVLQTHSHVETLKRIAQKSQGAHRLVVLLGHEVRLPGPLLALAVRVRHALSQAS